MKAPDPAPACAQCNGALDGTEWDYEGIRLHERCIDAYLARRLGEEGIAEAPQSRSSSEPEAEPAPKPKPKQSQPTAENPRLRAAHIVFQKWLGKDYDIDVLDAVLAAA